MVKAGKMKWNETVKANWNRARSSALSPRNIGHPPFANDFEHNVRGCPLRPEEGAAGCPSSPELAVRHLPPCGGGSGARVDRPVAKLGGGGRGHVRPFGRSPLVTRCREGRKSARLPPDLSRG